MELTSNGLMKSWPVTLSFNVATEGCTYHWGFGNARTKQKHPLFLINYIPHTWITTCPSDQVQTQHRCVYTTSTPDIRPPPQQHIQQKSGDANSIPVLTEEVFPSHRTFILSFCIFHLDRLDCVITLVAHNSRRLTIAN